MPNHRLKEYCVPLHWRTLNEASAALWLAEVEGIGQALRVGRPSR